MELIMDRAVDDPGLEARVRTVKGYSRRQIGRAHV